jgi:hypothetical protein
MGRRWGLAGEGPAELRGLPVEEAAPGRRFGRGGALPLTTFLVVRIGRAVGLGPRFFC